MPLTSGDRLGHYNVTALLGEGGMGQVWQATDTQLNRQVALKILPDAFAADPDRLARFKREAKILASLNHPNIGSIYGLEAAEGVRALVLELVEGPTLADRIKQRPIPLDAALPIAKQIAEALEAAHEQGVIRRDLKPANIKVKADGTVKVLDFGLAKAFTGHGPDADLSVPVQSPVSSIEIEPFRPEMTPEASRVLARAFGSNPGHMAAFGSTVLAKNEAFFRIALTVMKGPKFVATEGSRILGLIHWVHSSQCQVSGMVKLQGSVPSFVEKEKRRNLLLTKQIAQRGEGGIRREEGYHD